MRLSLNNRLSLNIITIEHYIECITEITMVVTGVEFDSEIYNVHLPCHALITLSLGIYASLHHINNLVELGHYKRKFILYHNAC